MKKRERIISCINHRNTDIIPWNIEMTNGFKNIYLSEKEKAADDDIKNHMLRIKYKKNKEISDNESIDIFGVKWLLSKDGGDVGIVNDYPCIKDDNNYIFPEINEQLALDICNQLSNEHDKFTMFSLTMGFFERAWSLRGMENIMADMLLDEKRTFEMFDNILEHHLKLLDLILDYDFDALYFGDDWGQQQQLIMGPILWRKYIKPGVSKIFEKAKSKGKIIVLHSCGDLRSIMGELIDIGVDVYNTIQPEIYDLANLKKEYGDDLCFYGGISTQQFLPFASAKEVKEETLKVLDTMSNNGGYILSPTHAVTPDIPVDNVIAMINASLEFSGISSLDCID